MRTGVSRVLAVLVVLVGLSVALIPKYVFPICESANLWFSSSYQPIMRCFWLGRVELLLGGLVAIVGVILLLRSTRDTRFVLGVVLGGLGLVIILATLNSVIGSTCGHANSLCQIGTKPAERIAGALLIIFGLILAAIPNKRCEQK